MNNTQLNEISQDLYDLLLNLHKKLLNPDELKKKFPLPPSHVKLLFILSIMAIVLFLKLLRIY
ncbi:MarR family transcriptional regulator [Clostridium botulinum A1 str. CFSAN002368]|nr:MarR family transcriptional regulator [Clostridium botulinum A1 str. CFSAN002368]